MIHEEIKKEIKDVIDNPNLPAHSKHAAMARVLKTMLHKGVDTGLDNSKPKKGSSRAVYFPSEPDDLTIDGTPTKMHTVLKIAFPGQLDKYNDSGLLLGEHQNLHEGDRYHQNTYGVLRHINGNSFETNDNGILAPVIHSHEDGHYVHMGKVSPIGAGEFRELTKNKDFPKGISHQEFYNAVNHEYGSANGIRQHSQYSDERMEKLKEHPLVQNAINYSLDTQSPPIEFGKANMGIWHHPVTGGKHIVISDSGGSADVIKEYGRARNKMVKEKHGWGPIW